MSDGAATPALAVERAFALVAVALSGGRRTGARLVSGEHARFGMNPGRTVVEVPYMQQSGVQWTTRTLTCGVALQCAPSKDVVAQFPLHDLTPRELNAFTLAEGRAALGWVAAHCPGLIPECERHLPALAPLGSEVDGAEITEHAWELARSPG